MTRFFLILTVALKLTALQVHGQTSGIVGLWKTPNAPAAIHYKFDSSGTMKYNLYGCLSNFQRTGHYTVSKDSIFITYDSLTTEEKFIYQIKTTPQFGDTLFIVDRHKIKIDNGLFIYDSIFSNGQKTPDSLKPEKIDISKIAGSYSDDPRCTLIIKKKNKYKTIMVAPRSFVSKGFWEIHNDTLICYLTNRNTDINNEGKKIKGKPIEFKFIIVGGKMYSIVDEKRVLMVRKE